VPQRTSSWEDEFTTRLVRKAIETDAPLLASSLHRYTVAEGLTWETLAEALGCTVPALNTIALCRPPRAESFLADVEAIADQHIDPERLLSLLRQLQILEAFQTTGQTSSDLAGQDQRVLLAALDREEDTSDATVAEEQAASLFPESPTEPRE
jgi:hypothetical protein